jgi:hypothetical protein
MKREDAQTVPGDFTASPLPSPLCSSFFEKELTNEREISKAG